MSIATFARDDLVKLMFRADFFEGNPDLVELQELIARCKKNWEESAAKSACRCGGSPRAVFECLDALLARLDTMRDSEGMTRFIAYVRAARNDARITAVQVYYRKDSKTPLLKVRFA